MSLELARHILVIFCLGFLAFISLRKKQYVRLNWSIFYSILYTTLSLIIVNYACTEWSLWKFKNAENNALGIPYDLLFIWAVLWGVLPVYVLKTKFIFIIAISLFWIDLLIMPELAGLGVLELNKNWIIGEILLIIGVFLPSYFWAYCFSTSRFIWLRALFQICIMAGVFVIGLPFILKSYGLIDVLNYHVSAIEFQILMIIAFPALVAVVDLVTKGKGTPFPYDKTQQLVTTGVYAYCRNPIQWSFTLLFIPLSIYHSSIYLLFGSVFSVAYVLGVSDFHENADMEKRYGMGWINYIKNVPKWFFQWNPKGIPNGSLFFHPNCHQCVQIKNWFQKRKTYQLEIHNSTEYTKKGIFQVTYVAHNGVEYQSVKAIANGLEHINLAFASLGWFIRMPVIGHFLQMIVNTMDFNIAKKQCEIK